MPVDPDTRTAVLAVLTNLADAYNHRRVEAVAALFANDPDVTLFGTGADERRVGPDEVRAQIQRDFDQSEAITISWTWYSIAAYEKVAWVAAEATADATVAGEVMHLPLRFTFVCEQQGAEWRVMHAHLSSPNIGQTEGHSFPAE